MSARLNYVMQSVHFGSPSDCRVNRSIIESTQGENRLPLLYEDFPCPVARSVPGVWTYLLLRGARSKGERRVQPYSSRGERAQDSLDYRRERTAYPGSTGSSGGDGASHYHGNDRGFSCSQYRRSIQGCA